MLFSSIEPKRELILFLIFWISLLHHSLAAKKSETQKCKASVEKTRQLIEAWNNGSIVKRFPVSVGVNDSFYINGALCLDGSISRDPAELKTKRKEYVKWVKNTCRSDYKMPEYNIKKINKDLAAHGVGSRCMSGKCTFRKEVYDPVCSNKAPGTVAELATKTPVTVIVLSWLFMLVAFQNAGLPSVSSMK